MVMRQLHICREKMNFNLDLTDYIKIQSKLIIPLNVRHETIKCLENNKGENLQDVGLSEEFLYMIPMY